METIAPLWLWAAFVVIVVFSLFIDFVVLKKQGAHDIGVKEALNWSLIWIALSFLFNGFFWWAVKDTTGSTDIANTKSVECLAGYLIEKSLAIDNIFVFLMIFTYFSVPLKFQKRVLMIGIIGAIVLRTVMILAGGWLLAEFHWILYVFGAFLIWAVLDFRSARKRPILIPEKAIVSTKATVITIASGVILWIIFIFGLHQYLIGVSPLAQLS